MITIRKDSSWVSLFMQHAIAKVELAILQCDIIVVYNFQRGITARKGSGLDSLLAQHASAKAKS
jgi:hypothetical protein